MSNNTADFGFKKVAKEQKQTLVQGVFSSVAPKYDIMNDLMSMGLHKHWKNELIKEMSPSSHEILLDMAGGTGDVAQKFIEAGGGHAIVADLNEAMLNEGKKKLGESQLDWVVANAEELPFEGESFDFYSISFGIRNVTNKDKALKEAHRVLKHGGKFVCLELSHVTTPIISQIYDFYSFKVIPKVGELIANDSSSYQYLVESIRNFPKPTIFKKMIEQAGFQQVSYQKYTFGVVAIHVGYKL